MYGRRSRAPLSCDGALVHKDSLAGASRSGVEVLAEQGQRDVRHAYRHQPRNLYSVHPGDMDKRRFRVHDMMCPLLPCRAGDDSERFRTHSRRVHGGGCGSRLLVAHPAQRFDAQATPGTCSMEFLYGASLNTRENALKVDGLGCAWHRDLYVPQLLCSSLTLTAYKATGCDVRLYLRANITDISLTDGRRRYRQFASTSHEVRCLGNLPSVE